MSRKLLAALVILVMAVVSISPIMMDGTDAASSSSVTVNPAPAIDPWVSKEPFAVTKSFNYNFTVDPYEGVVKYIHGEISLEDLKTDYGYTDSPSGEYYYVNYYPGSSGFPMEHIRSIPLFDDIGDISGRYEIEPNGGLSMYFNRDITAAQLRTGYKWTTDYTISTYCDVYYGGGTVYYTKYVDGAQTGYYSLTTPYTNLIFGKDPYSELQKFATKEVTLDYVKAVCEWQNPETGMYSDAYNVNLDENGNLKVTDRRYCDVRSQDSVLYGDMYYQEGADPYEYVVKYINGEIDLDELKDCCGGYVERSARVDGVKYYAVSINGSYISDGGNYVRTIPVTRDYIYLDPGKYLLTIEDTDCVYVNYDTMNPGTSSKTINITDGKGSKEIDIDHSDAIWFVYSNNYSTVDDNWKEHHITYSISPDPSAGKKMTDFTRSVMILSDKEWVKYTTIDRYTGSYSVPGGRYIFVQGSDEERAFVDNVVDKGRIDGSEYGKNSVDVSSSRLVIYQLRDSANGPERYMYIMDNKPEPGKPSYVDVDFTFEKMSVSGVKPYKFYANYYFSISVKYDPSEVKAVILMYKDRIGSTVYDVLESGRVYDYEMTTSSEYGLYYLPSTTTSAGITPVSIGIYTENVPEPDSIGSVFAIVAIVLCVLAFGTLFRAGRRPKWKDTAGLPKDHGSVSDGSDQKDE